MRRRIKVMLIVTFTIPLLYVILPIVNSFGCNFKSEIETENLLVFGVCKNGLFRTLTHFKDSGLTISNTALIAYRDPYLTSISLNRGIITPPVSANTPEAINILREEYLTTVAKRFHIKKDGESYFFLQRPSYGSNTNDNIIFKMVVHGDFSYWE